MSKQCVITGRKARTGNTRSHALNSTDVHGVRTFKKSVFLLTVNLNVFGFLQELLNQVKFNVFNI